MRHTTAKTGARASPRETPTSIARSPHFESEVSMKLSLCLAAAVVAAVPLALAACGGSSSGAGDAQTPPQGEAAVTTWLATGDYKKWHCEAAAHDARTPSPHMVNRICNNDILYETKTGN